MPDPTEPTLDAAVEAAAIACCGNADNAWDDTTEDEREFYRHDALFVLQASGLLALREAAQEVRAARRGLGTTHDDAHFVRALNKLDAALDQGGTANG